MTGRFFEVVRLTASLLAQIGELNVPERHFHLRSGVNLKSDDALRRQNVEILVDGRGAIELDCNMFADGLDVVVVELAGLEHLLDDLGIRLLHEAALADLLLTEMLAV